MLVPAMRRAPDIVALRRRLPRRSAVLGLLAPLLLCLAASHLSAKETEVKYDLRYAQVYGWDHIRLGVARIEYKGKAPYLSYALTGGGLNDLLNTGEEPQAHLKLCLAKDYPPGALWPIFEPAKIPRGDCLRLLLLWGDFLVEGPLGERLEDASAERQRGWRFLEQGFLLLLGDLKAMSGPKERLDLMESVRQLDFRVGHLMLISQFSPAVRAAALQYYSGVWETLPPAPDTYDAFMLKFATGEELKQFYFGDVTDKAPLDPRMANDALQFYQQAAQFHQLAFPAPRNGAPPRTLPAILREGVRSTGIAYAVFPGEEQLRPLAVLAHTDLSESELLLNDMQAANLISEAEHQAREKILVEENNKIKAADVEQWIGVALKQGDVRQAMDLRMQQVLARRDAGDLAGAQQILEQICAQLREQEDWPTWGARTVDLISYKIAREQWQAALDLIQRVKPVLSSRLLIKELDQTLGFEKLVREKLGVAPLDEGEVKQLTQSITDLSDLPDQEEPDRAKRLAALRSYLQRPNLPPFLRMVLNIQVANTLSQVGEAGEAEKLITSLLPEVRKWRGLPGELNLLEALLSLQSDRGNFGGFYSTLDRYEATSRKLYGENWIKVGGRRLAEIFFHLQDYHRAEALLAAQRKSEYLDALRNPIHWPYLEMGETPVDDLDLLLEARIQMELGQKDQALRTLKVLDASTAQVGEKRAVTDTRVLATKTAVLFQLADIYASLGQPKVELEKIDRLLSAIDPLQDINRWAKATLQAAQLRLAAGVAVSDLVAKMEELVPHVAEYHELEAAVAVDMDAFLADYYVGQKSLPVAMQRLQRGLALAEKSGAVDQQIVMHRKMGELAAQQNDLRGAAEHYRRSIALLKNVSRGIPSDLGKVGYRAARNKAIPLLVVTLYDLYRQTNDQKYFDEMVSAIEEGKARALAEMLVAVDTGQATGLNVIRQSLPAGAALVEYYVPEGVSDRIFRVTIDHTSPTVDVLGLNVGETTARIQALIEEVRRPEDFNETAFKTRAAEMGKVLLPASWLGAGSGTARQQVFIVPTGMLHLFPFELLVDAQGRYLGENEQLEIAYLPSASMLRRPAPRFAAASRSAGFVNPALDDDHHEALEEATDLRAGLIDAFHRWSGGEILWEKPLTARQFLAQAPQLDNVFLYSHGRFLPDDPTGSYLRFADDSGAVLNLSAAQLLATNVGKGLWVLAACSSGIEKVRAGDEALGLPRALLESGAGMVIISLWDVDATSSLDIMTRFYQNLAAGMPVARALRESSGALRKNGRPPYDWAPFILIGHHRFER